jgi:hypothetical protein
MNLPRQLCQPRILRNRLSSLEDRVGFTRVQDDGLADPFIVYLFGPRQIPQARVVVFLQLSVPDSIVHTEKYPVAARAGNAPFCNEIST